MNSFDDRMTELRKRFAERSRSERDSIAAAYERRDRSELQHIAHGLAGNGGLFGFPEISRAGQMLDETLDQGVEGELLRQAVEALLTELDKLRQPG